jgi:hypothetical protein
MIGLRHIVASAVAAAVLATGCADDDTKTESTPDQTSSEEDMAEQRQRLIIGPDRVACDDGAGPRTCLQVRRTETEPWELFYDQIEGFDPQEGTTYVIVVGVEEIDDPPIDGSSLGYRLIEVEESS